MCARLFYRSFAPIFISRTGNQELSPLQPDTNATEPDSPRTWAVASVVQIPTARERHGEKLKCVAIHESYAARSVAVEAKMDVKCEYHFWANCSEGGNGGEGRGTVVPPACCPLSMSIFTLTSTVSPASRAKRAKRDWVEVVDETWEHAGYPEYSRTKVYYIYMYIFCVHGFCGNWMVWGWMKRTRLHLEACMGWF